MSSKFSSPFMAKSPLLEDKKKKSRAEALAKAAKETQEEAETAKRAAFIRSKSDSEDYEESPDEKKAQRKYKKLIS